MTQEAAVPTLREALTKAIPALEIYHAYGWPDREGVIKQCLAALAARPADPVEPTTLPSSRERWNAENPGELSLHTFDDDATPAEPSVRAALEALLEHCGEQGWWLKVHAIKVMDAARAALQENPASPKEPTAREPESK